MAESREPGASVSLVARRYDLNANLLFTWRQAFARSTAAADGNALTFVPVAITGGPPLQPPRPAPDGRIEIVLGSGDRVLVGSDVNAAALARVVKVLSRR